MLYCLSLFATIDVTKKCSKNNQGILLKTTNKNPILVQEKKQTAEPTAF